MDANFFVNKSIIIIFLSTTAGLSARHMKQVLFFWETAVHNELDYEKIFVVMT